MPLLDFLTITLFPKQSKLFCLDVLELLFQSPPPPQPPLSPHFYFIILQAAEQMSEYLHTLSYSGFSRLYQKCFYSLTLDYYLGIMRWMTGIVIFCSVLIFPFSKPDAISLLPLLISFQPE